MEKAGEQTRSTGIMNRDGVLTMLYTGFLLLVSLMTSVFVCSCDEKHQQNQNQERVVASDTLNGMGEESLGDDITSADLKAMNHNGRFLVINFCYCCDCKITKPMLQGICERLSKPVDMITIDVKEQIDLSDEYGIRRSPFYMLFNEMGQMVDTLYGYGETDLLESTEIREWLEMNLVEGEGS